MKMSHHLKFILFISLFSIILYATTLQNGFLYDDGTDIVNNKLIRSFSNLPELFRKDSAFQAANWTFRPVLTFSFFIDYSLFGLKPWGFHLTNVLLHAANSALLYIFMVLLFKPSAVGGMQSRVGSAALGVGSQSHLPTFPPSHLPLLVSLFFAAHPALTEAVNAIADRGDLLAFLFYMATLSLYLYIRKEDAQSAWRMALIYSLSCTLYLLALLSKEMAITLPLIIYCYEWMYRDKKSGTTSILLDRYNLGYIALSFFYIYLRFFYFHVPGKIGFHAWNLHERMLTTPWLLVNYLKLAFFPVSLSADYSISPITTIFSLSAVLPLVVVAAILTTALSYSRKNKTISFGALFFFMTLLPAYNIIPIPNPFAERYIYLPMAGFAVVMGALMCLICETLEIRKHGLWFMVLVIMFCVYAVIVGLRNTVWHESFSLWTDTVRKSPGSVRSHNNLGLAYLDQCMMEEAKSHFKIALKLDPLNLDAHTNLGVLHHSEGRLEEAIKEYSIVLRLKPDSPNAHNNLGFAYYKQGKIDEAINEYKTALRLKPDLTEANINLGTISYDNGDLDGALKIFNKVLEFDPASILAHASIAKAYYKKGMYDEAVREYRIALDLGPDDAATHHNLGQAYRAGGRVKEALAEYMTALSLKPTFPEAHNDIGIIFAELGRTEDAIAEFKAAVEQKADFADAYYNLGNAYFGQGRLDDAVYEYKNSLRFKPDSIEVHFNLGNVYKTKGLTNEAREEFETVLKLDPLNQLARDAIENLGEKSKSTM